jgi:WD40 repeat protein
MDAGLVIERISKIEAGAAVVAAAFVRDTAVLACAEEELLLIGPDDDQKRVAVHHGAILAMVADHQRVLTGGDDGRVVSTSGAGTPEQVGSDIKRRWIERVAIAGDGTMAWSAGKDVTVRLASGNSAILSVPSAGGGLAFLPKSHRLAIAHAGGVTLWQPGESAEVLEHAGAHAEVSVSADGEYLISAMHLPILVGWHLDDRQKIQLAGYAERVRVMDWTADGRWLATSGANRLTLWPVRNTRGPTMPLLLAPYQHPVTAIACHPGGSVVAVGYADGLALLVKSTDGAEILIGKPNGAPVSALAWNQAGSRLAIGLESGGARILSVSGLQAA